LTGVLTPEAVCRDYTPENSVKLLVYLFLAMMKGEAQFVSATSIFQRLFPSLEDPT
jgi:hypothetical protein